MNWETQKTYLFFSDHDQGHPHLVDTIFHEGAWWLVASWLQANATGERTPERLVRLTGLRHEEVAGQPYRFLLNSPIPKSVFDGQAQAGYVAATFPLFGDTPASNDNPLN
jgi:hypothetical protein